MGSVLTPGVNMRTELNFWMPRWCLEKSLLVLENKSQNWCQEWDLLEQSGLMETCGLGEKKSEQGMRNL